MFGMATAPLDPVEVPPPIQALLSKNSVAYVFAHTKMAPGGEDVIVYYPSPKDEDGSASSSPAIAVVRGAKLEKKFEYQKHPYWHNVIAAYVTFSLDEKREAFGLCVTNSGDGHYSDFLIVTWTPLGYQAVFTNFGNSQAQVRISRRGITRLELWSPDGYPPGTPEESRCIWCPQFYRVTTSEWRGDKFVKTGNGWRTKEPLNPGSVASQAFVLLNPQKTE